MKIKKWLLIFFGTLTWSLTMVKSGLSYDYGIGFWGANGHDGIWHIALAEGLSRGSFQMPVFAGFNIQNYHLGFDLLLAFLNKITFIPIINLYFQVIPVVLAVLIGILTHKFILDWTKSDKAAWWSTFFVYFGGSLGWLIGRGESVFWSQEAISTLINPPFALSLVLILVGLIILIKDKKKFIDYLVCITLFGILIEVKVYAGILVLGGLFVSGIYQYVKDKRKDISLIFFGSFIVSLILFLPSFKSSSKLIIWQPFWFLETMMGLTDRLNWVRFYSAMTNYRLGKVWFKAVPAYLVAFTIFWVGNMWTRLIKEFKVWNWLKNFEKVSSFEVFISSIIVAGGLIPMLFVQSGTPWNTIQFFYYSLFFSSILAGVAMEDVLNKIKNTTIIRIMVVSVVLLTIPTTIITLKDVYIPSRPPAMISKDESSALKFLSNQSVGVVLTRPFDEFAAKAAENNPPRPLYLYTSTGYVSAFSKHETFLEDEINLDITGYDWKTRREQVLNWYKEKEFGVKRTFLLQNNIKYIYWIKSTSSPLDLGKLGLSNIYENDLITIYRVD